MNLFVGAHSVSFSDTTDCHNTVTMTGVGFDAKDKLFVFIGSAAPVIPFSVAYGINSTTPLVVYNDSRYPLPTTASFEDVAITGSLSSRNRLEGASTAVVDRPIHGTCRLIQLFLFFVVFPRFSSFFGGYFFLFFVLCFFSKYQARNPHFN